GMKFLLELVVPCFGSQQFHHSAVDDSISGETQSLMKQRRRRKRVRLAGQPGQEWRPSNDLEPVIPTFSPTPFMF
ncbi:hypothetical protein HID58_051430, partial [Brassica napus]